MNLCLKPCASCTEASQELNLCGSPIVADRPLNATRWSENGFQDNLNHLHYRARSQKQDLFPGCTTILLPNSMDLIQNNPTKLSVRCDQKPTDKKNDLFILGNQVRASGGDNIIIDNISGTVTRI